MNQKKMIMTVMAVGSILGGVITTKLGFESLSFASIVGSTIGGAIGIWIGYKLS